MSNQDLPRHLLLGEMRFLELSYIGGATFLSSRLRILEPWDA